MLGTLKKSFNFYSHIKINGIHTSNILCSSRQTGNAMRKVLGVSRKKKFHLNEDAKMPSPDTFSKGSFEGKYSGNLRRATVLNKLFMMHITDQMATGQCSSLILGHGLEINRVQVTPDYKVLRVYWTARKTDDVEQILQKCACLLRHELSQLRVMGCVPIIQFVKDKNYARIVELDKRLAIADFGLDHTPLNLIDKFKTEVEITAPLGSDIKEKLKELDSKESEEFENLPLPLMPQNVYGLQRAEILDRVKKSMKKATAQHRHKEIKASEENWASFKTTQSVNDDPVYLGDLKSQRIAFKEFLHKRQLLRLKARSAEHNIRLDMESLSEEINENESSHLNKFDIIENEDFILEDIDEKN